MLKLIAASFSKFDHLLRTGNPNFQICDALSGSRSVGWLVQKGVCTKTFKEISFHEKPWFSRDFQGGDTWRIITISK